MAYTFLGESKLIVLQSGSSSFTAQDVYSRWKDWVQTGSNSKFLPAFRSVGGDPIGVSSSVSPYIFLNNTDGWRIRPSENDAEVSIVGNIYPENSALPTFVPTLGDFTVTMQLERSVASISSIAETSQTTVQGAMTAQGYTSTRAAKIDSIDSVTSGTNTLTNQQLTLLTTVYELMGLDPTKPLVVSSGSRSITNTSISQSITTVTGTVTVQRL